MDRISTGVSALDQILGGGIPQGSTVLLAGRPGSGKTILATQMLFHNATRDAKVAYLTTLSEPQVKILKYQQEFSFFSPEKVQDSVVYHDLREPLRRHGPKQALEIIDRLLKAHQPRLLVIDTIKTMSEMIGSLIDTREFILELTLRTYVWNCTTVLIGEYSEEEIEIRPESAIADGIIYMSGNEERKYQRRFLRILKMRGTRYQAGENIFTISHKGIDVFPRLNPVIESQNYVLSGQKLSTGIPTLDQMMGGGIIAGTTTLICGGPGVGKTALAQHFACEGLLQGEKIIFITFEEHPHQIINNAASIGLNMASFAESGHLYINHLAPIEISIDKYVYALINKVREMGASRVIVDSISSFEVGMSDKIKYTDHIWSMCDCLKSLGVSTLLTHETPYGSFSEATRHGISYIADNLIVLHSDIVDLTVKIFLHVVKMRGSSHAFRPAELLFAPIGLQLIPL